MDKKEFKGIIEALLFVSGDPVSIRDLAGALEIEQKEVMEIIREMKDQYNFERRGIQIIEVDGHFQLATRPEHFEFIQRLYSPQRKQGLSQAALETLAIIAYKQPITRAEIDTIRGVQSDKALYTLSERKLIQEVDRLDTVGRPILYGTTIEFLRYFGFKSIDDLPQLLEEQITYLDENTR
ncbi:MAG: Segregation and condensation protein B [Firmicutes bacterium]|nr:Segregation and condensation protein B [Bacillota bacterium]MDI6707155.1 SMC-Scp complex subunit ScpB [Bacillota bacterium]